VVWVWKGIIFYWPGKFSIFKYNVATKRISMFNFQNLKNTLNLNKSWVHLINWALITTKKYFKSKQCPKIPVTPLPFLHYPNLSPSHISLFTYSLFPVLRQIEEKLKAVDPEEAEIELDDIKIPKITDEIKAKFGIIFLTSSNKNLLEKFKEIGVLCLNGCGLESLDNLPKLNNLIRVLFVNFSHAYICLFIVGAL